MFTNTQFYDAIDMLVLQGVVVLEGGSVPYPLHTYIDKYIYTCIYINIHACLQTHMVSVFWISVFLKFPDLQKYGNSRNTEIWKSRNNEIMCVCRQIDMYVSMQADIHEAMAI